jgi:hypothetical protein
MAVLTVVGRLHGIELDAAFFAFQCTAGTLKRLTNRHDFAFSIIFGLFIAG